MCVAFSIFELLKNYLAAGKNDSHPGLNRANKITLKKTVKNLVHETLMT